MLALALVLLALVAVLVVVSFVGSSEEAVVEFLNVTITTSVGRVFVAGFVAGLVALASLYSIRTSLRRIQKRREEVRELRERAGQAAPATAPTTEAGQEDHPLDETAAEPGPTDRRPDSEVIADDRDKTGPAEGSGGSSPDHRPARHEDPPAAPADADPGHPPGTQRS